MRAAVAMADPIKFKATIAKVQTLADGGIRLTLDLPETAILQAAQLMEVRRQIAIVEASLVPAVMDDENCTDSNDETKKGAEGSGSEVDSRRTTIRRDK